MNTRLAISTLCAALALCAPARAADSDGLPSLWSDFNKQERVVGCQKPLMSMIVGLVDKYGQTPESDLVQRQHLAETAKFSLAALFLFREGGFVYDNLSNEEKQHVDAAASRVSPSDTEEVQAFCLQLVALAQAPEFKETYADAYRAATDSSEKSFAELSEKRSNPLKK